VGSTVRLTLSRDLEESAGRILYEILPKSGGRSASSAAITLMDGMTGELLALPSWPPEPEAATGSAASQLNQNFTRHSIGSVAKILFAPPVLETHTNLLKLKVHGLGPSGGSFATILGIPLRRSIEEEPMPPGDLDFIQAIAHSSNHYATTLLTLGSDNEKQVASGSQAISPVDDYYYDADAKWHDTRPLDLVFDQGAPDSLNVRNLQWVERMTHLFDLNFTSSSDEDRVSRRYVWDALPAALRPVNQRMLDTMSPEYENLQLEAIRPKDFPTKFVSLILGAGESRWTNVALAEAAASLIRNKPVRASIVARSPPTSDDTQMAAAPLQWRDLSTDVHQALADAMSAVVLEGTANILKGTRAELARNACERGQVFGLFAKTGTPVLVESHLSPEATIFNEMASAQLFSTNGSGQIVYTGLASDGDMAGRALTRRDIGALTQLRDRGVGKVADDFAKYFRNPTAATQEAIDACKEIKPRRGTVATKLWARLMNAIAANNETPEFPMFVNDGHVIAYTHECTRTNKKLNGRHIVLVAATYPRSVITSKGNADCQGSPVSLDVNSQPPVHLIVAVVAIVDPSRMHKTLNVAEALLRGPIAAQLGLKSGEPLGKGHK
jgi:hypothetical protein